MEKVLTAIVFAAMIIFVSPLIGAFSGWVVSLLFEETIRETLAALNLNISSIEIWQLGATLGFVGGFFKSSCSSKS